MTKYLSLVPALKILLLAPHKFKLPAFDIILLTLLGQINSTKALFSTFSLFLPVFLPLIFTIDKGIPT